MAPPQKIRRGTANGTALRTVEDGPAVFKPNDGVYAMGKDQIWYEAKVQKVDKLDGMDDKSKVWGYLIHYVGWSVKFDEWLSAENLLPLSPESLKKIEEDNEAVKAGRTKAGAKGAETKPDAGTTSSQAKKTKGVVATAEKARKPVGKQKGRKSVTEEKMVIKEETKSREPSMAQPGSVGSSSTTEALPESPTSQAQAAIEKSSQTTRVRTPEEYWRMVETYDAFDPDAKQKTRLHTEEAVILEYNHLINAKKAGKKSSYELQRMNTDCFDKLAQISYAKLRKTKDVTIHSVDLPPKVKRALAVDYIQIVFGLKVPKKPDADMNVESILKRYREHGEKEKPSAERSAYWLKARDHEVDHFLENFVTMLPFSTYRQEHPKVEELKEKGKKADPKTEYGAIQLIKQILFMVNFYNEDGKRAHGRLMQRLMAIFQDMISYIEEQEMPKLPENLEELYEETSEEYRQKISFYNFEPDQEMEGHQTFSIFHYPTDQIWAELAKVKPEDEWKVDFSVHWETDPSGTGSVAGEPTVSA